MNISVNNPADSEHTSDLESSFIPRTSEQCDNLNNHYPMYIRSLQDVEPNRPHQASSSSTGRIPNIDMSNRSWYDISDRRELRNLNNRPVTRSWYDMSQGEAHSHARRNNSNTRNPVTRSWYDISDGTNEWYGFEQRTLPLPSQRHLSPLLRHQGGAFRTMNESTAQPPPAYHAVVTENPDDEAPPPTYASVINRESSL